MRLEFGDGTDNDTFDNVFGRMADGRYIIEVNGVDIELTDTYGPDGRSGLLGLRFDDETGEGEPGNERFFPWEAIESVTIY